MSYALIALPDARLAGFLASALKQDGLKPVVVADGAAALAQLKRAGKPSLLLCELSLAAADGFAVLAALRKLATPDEAPAVVISAFVNLRSQAESRRRELGLAAVLPTALPPSRILEFVRKARQKNAAPPPPDARVAAALANRVLPEDAAREKARLQVLEKYAIVDDLPPDMAMQHLLENTARVFKVGTALISIVTQGRQWFKGYYGIDGQLLRDRGTGREISFCTHVVGADTHAALVVPDAAANPCFSENPLVQSGAVRSYVGAPLVSPEGHVAGTLCLIDRAPSKLTAEDVGKLQKYAAQVAATLFRAPKPSGGTR